MPFVAYIRRPDSHATCGRKGAMNLSISLDSGPKYSQPKDSLSALQSLLGTGIVTFQLDHTSFIDRVFARDKKTLRTQRQIAKHMYDRLTAACGYTGPYRTIAQHMQASAPDQANLRVFVRRAGVARRLDTSAFCTSNYPRRGR